MSIPPLLSVSELRAQCRVDDPAEDAILLGFGAAAERHVESLTSQVLTGRTEYVRDTDFPHDAWHIVRFPVHGVVSIEYVDTDGLPAAMPTVDYVLQPARVGYYLRAARGAEWPEIATDSEVNIALSAGYPNGECPTPLRQACLLLAAHFYVNREAVAPGAWGELPLAMTALVDPYRLRLDP